ncbi:MAG: isoprenyl transferase [Bacteroidales bacterium]|nr:isoprenyl transferase [Bacteroidales bacterium]
MGLKEQIDLTKLPQHIAIIMDGNGRWAKQHGQQRVFGHRNGVTAVRESAEAAAELGIPFLTVYAFSTENWNRPKVEVNALMKLLLQTIENELTTLNKNNIRLNAIGDLGSLPKENQKKLQKVMDDTRHNSRMTLTLALSYSGRWDLVEAARALARKVAQGECRPEDVDADLLNSLLSTSEMPDPELLIRTSGEYRISNFLLWQIAYAELYFTLTLWPDFRRDDLYAAIIDYQHRERRFGKTSDQIKK